MDELTVRSLFHLMMRKMDKMGFVVCYDPLNAPNEFLHNDSPDRQLTRCVNIFPIKGREASNEWGIRTGKIDKINIGGEAKCKAA